MRIKNPTLRDIAKLANVSHTTVSLALSFDDSKPSRVSPKIRERVQKIAEQLNYRPNQVARSLVTKKTKTIGLVLTTLHNPFYAELAQDIIDRARDFDYKVFMASARRGIEEEKEAVESLIDRGVDGLIICPALREDKVVQHLIEIGVPFVLAMRNVDRFSGMPSVHHVGIDNKRGAYLAIEHLLKMNHRRIGLIAGPDETSTGHDRRIGALDALNVYYVPQDMDLLITGDFSRRSGYEAACHLLKLKKSPTAIFAMNDFMALGVLEALRDLGVSVPDDIALIGFDDIMIAGIAGIDLTTVSQKKEIMGKLSFDCLLELIKDGPPNVIKTSILEPILVIRKTCGFYKQQKDANKITNLD